MSEMSPILLSQTAMKNDIRITDLHSHILPYADHGSGSPATSKRQLELLAGAGIDRVVATPHFYPSEITVGEFLTLRESCANALADMSGGDLPEMVMGAEVFVCRGLDEMKELERLCIEGTNTILLEMPFGEWSEPLIETVGLIRRRGLIPVIAHIDRYYGKPIGRLFEAGALCQVNASALVSRRRRRWLLSLAEEGSICALGSDIHGADRSCARDFSRACGLLGEGLRELMRRTDMLLRGAKAYI